MERASTTSLSRRRLVAMGGATLLAGLAARSLPGIARADGTADDAETLGYPALTVTVEDKAIQMPARVPAGLTFVTLQNSAQNFMGAAAWGRLPDGAANDDVTSAVAGANPEDPASLGPLGELLGTMTLLGGPTTATSGQEMSGVVRFTEGKHAFIDVFGGRVAFFEVGPPAAGAKTEPPKADIVVKLGNMVFVGLDQGVAAGKKVWQVENIDKMQHELAILPIDPAWTEEDVKKAAMAETPEEGPDMTKLAGAITVMNGGLTAWQVIDLAPGHYAAVCQLPMNWSGPPHAAMGMIKVFDAK